MWDGNDDGVKNVGTGKEWKQFIIFQIVLFVGKLLEIMGSPPLILIC